MTPVIAGIGRSEGRAVPVASLVDTVTEHSTIAKFEADGFRFVLESDKNVAQMASAAMTNVLLQTGSAPETVSSVIISSESYWDIGTAGDVESEGVADRGFAHGLISSLIASGLQRATPHANWISGCANSLLSVRLAASLVASGHSPNALVCVSDRVGPQQRRVMQGNLGIYSDLAAACLVVDGGPGVQVGPIVSDASLALATLGKPEHFGIRADEMIRSLRSLRRTAHQVTGHRFSDYDLIVTDNVTQDYLAFVAACLAISPDQLLCPSKPEIGHAYAADWLVSLASLQAAGVVRPGNRIGILNCGSAVFSFGELTAT